MANPRFAQLLDRAEDALEAGNADDALTLANEMLGDEPDDVDALDVKAVALRHLGELEAAAEVYGRLREVEPKNPAWPLAEADLLVRDAEDDRELIEQGLEVLDAAERLVGRDPELRFELELLRATALNQLGDFADALASVEVALGVDPTSAEAQLEQGQALFELGRFDEARRVYQALAREYPDEAWAHHALGLLAERRGEDPGPHFARARSLSPEEFPPPVHLTAEAFDQAVAEAIEALPEHARPALENCIIDVQPIPTDEDLKEGGVSPLILGVFRGAAVDERSPVSAADHQTAHITLYQNNLERFARTREELLEEIRITVLHEVGHLLGLDEDELYERGLD
ncbi:MAG: metallopeptidase family protein [Myxococcaceae bacterium]|nr:metallopeptidase family protein [Myxococcaceae bacterium]